MAKQLYDYWFVQFDFPNEEGKPYKSSGGEMVWNEKLKREIPKDWHRGTLLDIAEYTNGLACQKYRPTDENKLPVIKIKEMHDGLSPDTEWVKADIPESVKVYDGDILFSWSASLEVMLWAYGNGGLNQHIFKVTSKNGYPRSFYFYQLKHYIGVFKQMAEARKTTMGHITQDHLKQSTIALPSNTDVTNKLEEKLCPIFDAIVKNNQEIMSLTKQRDELLPLLMNGQATVNYHLSSTPTAAFGMKSMTSHLPCSMIEQASLYNLVFVNSFIFLSLLVIISFILCEKQFNPNRSPLANDLNKAKHGLAEKPQSC